MKNNKKKKELQLFSSEEKYRTIFNANPNLIISINDKGVIIDCNNAARKFLGYNKIELVGKPMSKIVHPGYLKKLKKSLNEIMKNGYSNDKEYKMITKENQLIDVIINSVGLKEGRAKYVKALCFIRDVTEEKKAKEKISKAYEELKKADEIKSTILRDVSHELRTPTSVITLAANLLKDEVKNENPNKDKINRYVDILMRNSNRFETEIDSVLELSRIRELNDIEKKEINIRNIIDSIYEEFIPKVKEKGIRLILDIDIGKNVTGNEYLFRRMIKNLVSNAVKFTDKGRVKLKVFIKKGHAIIAVSDTGRGIPKKDYERIFEQFVRLEPNVPGVGVGLTLTKRIAELHDGKVNVRSILGKGSAFEISIPIKKVKNGKKN